MKNKITYIKSLAFLITLCCAVCIGYAQSIYSNEITGTNPSSEHPFLSGQIVDENITVSGIVRGSGIATQNGNGIFNARGWHSPALDANDYFEFTLTPNASFEIDFLSFEYTSQVSVNNAPTNIAIRSNIDNFVSDIGTPTLTGTTIDLSSATYQNVSSAITFRVYLWGARNNGGTFGLDNFAFNGVIKGTCSSPTVTWTAGNWTPNAPDINTPVTIDDNYDTATTGNFSACSLTVNVGNTLTVDNGDYVEVQNNIIVDGVITVETEGAVIQNFDGATVTENGTITVIKTTAPSNDWYEYTYWSSPVSNETILGGLTDTEPNRRFLFNGSNFLDATMETGNNNATVPGQDDIDDDGNDWVSVNGTDTMTPGVGYATTQSEFSWSIAPGTSNKQFDYTFEGPFNNGVITVPIFRNDSETNDNNWNFIGNPYPSAIDADLFLAANTNIDTDVNAIGGALFLWSQNSAPSSTENGNENLNFAASDYAIINATGQTAGGDGVIPNRYIPSGQGFFVSLSDAATVTVFAGDIKTTDIVFNNSMRVKGTTDNNQFFRISGKKSKKNNNANKLWLDLTSDNGVFNQTLIGYVSGATNGYDGMAYDAPKNLSTEASATLYSNIDGSNKKFAIQGKEVNSLTEKENISIGFNTTIDVPTIYTLSIAQFEGDFLENNVVLLKDNLLNTLHNLKLSDYNFASEAGEFNERFEILFDQEALSTDENLIKDNALSITEQQNGSVEFKLSSNFEMASIQIIDLQGRVLHSLNAKGHNNTYNLSNLSQAPYIAKVTLSNGYVITKKAIKRL